MSEDVDHLILVHNLQLVEVTGRMRHSAVLGNDETIYIYGGGSGGRAYLNTIETLDICICFKISFKNCNRIFFSAGVVPKTKKISPKDAPPERHSHSAVFYGKDMFVFGGMGQRGQMNDFIAFDISIYLFSFLRNDQSLFIYLSAHYCRKETLACRRNEWRCPRITIWTLCGCLSRLHVFFF